MSVKRKTRASESAVATPDSKRRKVSQSIPICDATWVAGPFCDDRTRGLTGMPATAFSTVIPVTKGTRKPVREERLLLWP